MMATVPHVTSGLGLRKFQIFVDTSVHLDMDLVPLLFAMVITYSIPSNTDGGKGYFKVC